MGLKIKRFKLKEGRPTQEDLEKYGFREGGSWLIKDAKTYTSANKIVRKEDFQRYRDYEISFNLAFNDDPTDFNDFDNVLILDEEFCQPYTPFYGYMGNNDEKEPFPFLAWVISEYNEWMSGFDFLEEVRK